MYGFDSFRVKDGSIIAVACDYYFAGIEAAEKAVRVLKGESPAVIPFSNVQAVKLIINSELASRYDIQLSDALLQRAEIFSQ